MAKKIFCSALCLLAVPAMGLSSASAAEKINTDPKPPLPWPDTKATAWSAESGALRVHNIFGSNMAVQRDKPITIWGWAETGQIVSVQFGNQRAETTAEAGKGRWEVTFPAQPADATGRKLEEAKRAVEILERLKTLGRQDSKAN
jgi:hypothetical protein